MFSYRALSPLWSLPTRIGISLSMVYDLKTLSMNTQPEELILGESMFELSVERAREGEGKGGGTNVYIIHVRIMRGSFLFSTFCFPSPSPPLPSPSFLF